MNQSGFIKTLLASAALGAFFAALPVQLESRGAGLSLALTLAFADDGGGGDDNSGSGSGGGDEDNSGSGGSDDDEDSVDEDGDDGGGEDGGQGSGGSPNSGSGNSGSGENSGSGGRNWFFLNDGTRVEIDNGGREIRLFYANGWREEIRGGRYVLRDDDNRLVVDRAATEGDYARLQGLLAA